jgi:hypothetical protein
MNPGIVGCNTESSRYIVEIRFKSPQLPFTLALDRSAPHGSGTVKGETLSNLA